MDKFQLECIPSGQLIKLRADINEELSVRRKKIRLSTRIDRSSKSDPLVFNTRNEIEEFNSSNILGIPGHKERKHGNCSIYLNALINQDWSHIFNYGDDENKYYVYAHVDPTKAIFSTSHKAGGSYSGTPFYIGKGVGNRAFDLNRNQGHGKILKSLLSKGVQKENIVKIIFDGLSEKKAYEIEAKLIYFFGTVYDKSIKKNGVLYNLDIPPIPDFVGVMTEYPSRSFFKQKNADKEAGMPPFVGNATLFLGMPKGVV